MRNLICSLAILVGLAQGTWAEDKKGLVHANGVAGWEAVGRLNIAGINMCTGALIGSDLVLTAAHCLYDTRTGKMVDPTRIEFQAGLYGGRAKASRTVTRAVVHGEYQYRPVAQSQIGHDLALLRLASPISGDIIKPFQTDDRPSRGDAVGVISYTQAWATSPNLEKPCYVMSRRHETLVMSCQVDIGASGAPVLVIEGGRNPRLVSVISAKARVGGKAVSIGTVLDLALKQLLKRAG